MDLNIIQVILVIIVAFLAGMEGILDEFQFHQPVVACTLIGLVTGNLVPCLILGGTLQMIALGWANIGAAVAPDLCISICCICNYFSFRWSRFSRRFFSNRDCCATCCCWFIINNHLSYDCDSVCSFDGSLLCKRW